MADSEEVGTTTNSMRFSVSPLTTVDYKPGVRVITNKKSLEQIQRIIELMPFGVIYSKELLETVSTSLDK